MASARVTGLRQVGKSTLFKSGIMLAYALGFWLCIHLLVILYEEGALAKKFGAAYANYGNSVPGWIPEF